MQKMLYKKNGNSTPEVVWMLSAYAGADGKLKAVIMRNHPNVNPLDWNCCPYDEVRLNRLRPLTADFNKVFAQ